MEDFARIKLEATYVFCHFSNQLQLLQLDNSRFAIHCSFYLNFLFFFFSFIFFFVSLTAFDFPGSRQSETCFRNITSPFEKNLSLMLQS